MGHGVERGTTRVYPAAVRACVLPTAACRWSTPLASLSQLASDTNNTLPTAVRFLFCVTGLYFGAQQLRAEESACSSAAV